MKFGKRAALLVAAGVVALLVGLVASFPARLALAWFAPPQVRAWGVDGTLWQGRAAEIVVEGRVLGALAWRARPARFVALQPTWDLDLRRADGFATGRVGLSLFGARQTITNFDAALSLANLPPVIVPNGVSGQASLSLARLELRDGWPTTIVGRAAVADLKLPGVIMALGPFEFLFPEQSATPLAQIRSLGGPLAVDGRIELPERDRWRFSAELAPGENPPRELVDGLAFVGEDLGGGRRRLELSSEP